MKKNIYFFQWPSDLGGADTRLKELIQCFNSTNNYNLFCIPNDEFRLLEHHNVSFLKENNVKILKWEELPNKDNGYAISFCNFRLFSEKWRILKINSMGLKFIWSNDMMWSTKEEIECINENLIHSIIFTSDFHSQILLQKTPINRNINYFIVPNYFHLDKYKQGKQPKKEHLNSKFVIGKLSRADLNKYSENFPLFYDKIPIENKHLRFMGCNKNFYNKYSWFNFKKDNWEILLENEEGINEFLSQLDLYVFNAHHYYIENQSRSIIEAQLLGIPVLVPNYGNFSNMIWHSRTGYIYNSIEDCYNYILNLHKNKSLYNKMSELAKSITPLIWCDIEEQISHWENIFKKYE